MDIDLIKVSDETNTQHYKLIKETCKSNGWGIDKDKFFIINSEIYAKIVQSLLLSISKKPGDVLIQWQLMELTHLYTNKYSHTILNFN